MIGIVNTGDEANGRHRYELYINRDFITEFWHVREAGLARCLEAAALAVRIHEADAYVDMFLKAQGEKDGTEEKKVQQRKPGTVHECDDGSMEDDKSCS